MKRTPLLLLLSLMVLSGCFLFPEKKERPKLFDLFIYRGTVYGRFGVQTLDTTYYTNSKNERMSFILQRSNVMSTSWMLVLKDSAHSTASVFADPLKIGEMVLVDHDTVRYRKVIELDDSTYFISLVNGNAQCTYAIRVGKKNGDVLPLQSMESGDTIGAYISSYYRPVFNSYTQVLYATTDADFRRATTFAFLYNRARMYQCCSLMLSSAEAGDLIFEKNLTQTYISIANHPFRIIAL